MKIIISLLILISVIPFLVCNNLINDADKETDRSKYDSFIKTVNPSSGDDELWNMKIDDEYIYVAGSDSVPGNNQWRIEKRYKLNGNYVTSFGTNGVVQTNLSAYTDEITDIAIDTNYIYIVGYDEVTMGKQPRIEKRDIVTGDLVTAFDGNGIIDENFDCEDRGLSIAIDANYIYLGMTDASGAQDKWRIEKRDIETGALIGSFGTGGIVEGDDYTEMRAMVLDRDEIFIASYDNSLGNVQWRIEKIEADDGGLKTDFGTGGIVTSNPSNFDDELNSIAIDHFGLLIAGSDRSLGTYNGQWRIERRDPDSGELTTSFHEDGIFQFNPSSNDSSQDESETIWKITLSGSNIYATGMDLSQGYIQGNIQKLNSTTGEYVSEFGTNGILNINIDDKLYAVFSVTADGDYIYLLGAQLISTGDFQIRLEKRRSDTGGF